MISEEEKKKEVNYTEKEYMCKYCLYVGTKNFKFYCFLNDFTITELGYCLKYKLLVRRT